MFNMSGIEYVCVWVVYACAYLHASTCIIRMCVCVCVCVCVRECVYVFAYMGLIFSLRAV